ncbi:MAG TPA: nuclear transport factor 2 family protein [Solirubrobacteraceae bacterium]|nr:nuclear transport factor 2 family protein [Solirubrobacteraceae bacterium]
MPSDARSVVYANSAAFSRMDIDGMLANYAENAVVVDCRRVSMGTFSGHAELRAYYLSIFHSASELHEKLRIIAEHGNVVVADCELRGRLAGAPARASDVVVPYGLVIRIDDGRIAYLELHESGADALAASEDAG